jgi:hypothetical protein
MRKCLGMILICSLFFVFIFCNAKKKNSYRAGIENIKQKDDTIITNISPLFKKKISKDFFPPDINRVGLDDLRKGYDQLQIRIWLGYALSDSAKVISITKKNEKWTASIYYYKYINKNSDSSVNVISVDKKYEQGFPTKGWEYFGSRLNDLDIFNLKDYSKIPNYYLCNDGDGIILEIATVNKYQAYAYPCYESYWEKLNEVKKIKNLLYLIQSEIGLYICRFNSGKK